MSYYNVRGVSQVSPKGGRTGTYYTTSLESTNMAQIQHEIMLYSHFLPDEMHGHGVHGMGGHYVRRDKS